LEAFESSLFVAGVGRFGQPIAVEGGGNDDFQLTACVEHGLGEKLVRAIGKITHAGDVLSGAGELFTDGLVHELLGVAREASVPGDRYAHQVLPVA
jgi:hypothetical protein